MTNLDLMVSEYERILNSVLDELAPMKEKTITLRPTNPWFTEDIKQQKCVMRNREWAWRKYKLPSNWRAFQIERNKYKSMLRSVHKSTLSKKIDECGNDTKKLYSLVNGLMGRTSENPMPESESDDQLAENFADFFIENKRKYMTLFGTMMCTNHVIVKAISSLNLYHYRSKKLQLLLEKWLVSRVRSTLSLLLYLRKYYQV